MDDISVRQQDVNEFTHLPSQIHTFLPTGAKTINFYWFSFELYRLYLSI